MAVLLKITLRLLVACAASLLLTAFLMTPKRRIRLQLSKQLPLNDAHNRGLTDDGLQAGVQLPGGDHDSSDLQPDRSNVATPEPRVPQTNITPDFQIPSLPPENELILLKGSPGDTYNEIFSVSTVDGKYSTIEFGNQEVQNPNVIPHPFSDNIWIIVAQGSNGSQDHAFHTELVCDAIYRPDGVLACENEPLSLPIQATSSSERCRDQETLLSNVKVFYGPEVPYIIYGSNSQSICSGHWIVDFRTLLHWTDPKLLGFTGRETFQNPTELQLQKHSGDVEKNWFMFWDANNEPYVHYDLFPQRSLAKINADGSVGTDLTGSSYSGKEECLSKYMYKILNKEGDSIHQSTNSLSITLCRHFESGCKPDDMNTYIMTLFHKKTHNELMNSYESYVMLFQHPSPFRVYGMSRKPLWIHGQKEYDGKTHENVRLTSIAWKKHGQKYHGYSDDIIFLAFEIDNTKIGGIDVLASDLLKDMDLCVD